MGHGGNVLVKSAVILILLGALAVSGYENDDLVFDQDGRSSAVEVPLIERQKDQSFFQRVKRSIFDWWKPSTTTPSPTPDDSAGENQTTESTYDQTLASNLMLNTLTDEKKDRPPRESGEENAVDQTSPKDENNDVGNTAAGYPSPDLPIYATTDDEDLGGSGEVEVRGGSGDWDPTDVPLEPRPDGQPQYYRIRLTVIEPYRREYSDRSSADYKELASNITKAIVDLYRERIPNEKHSADVVMISPLADPFSTQVTIDVGSMFDDELEIRQILENQLEYHKLGSLQIRPDGFTFHKVQAGGVPECDENSELRCSDGTCIPLSQRCDGFSQCPDNSDELDCPTETTTELTRTLISDPERNPKCRGDDFTVACYDNSRVICSLQKCDGNPDCDDGSDERGCNSTGCGQGEFSCDVTRCILDSKRCDFKEDCEDGSDEHNCNYPVCTPNEFKCRNSQCIATNLRCNGAVDCHDGSDEHNCPCKDGQFECTPLFCISSDRICDGYKDCSNGRDEDDCDNNTRCRDDEFECHDGNCVSLRAKCDGRSDCPDRSDERNCTVITCSSHQFSCQDGECVGIEKVCDGLFDCRNGEDEAQCGCGPSEFSCNDGHCISFRLQCNGVNDCRDGSDERDCVKAKTAERRVHNARQHDPQFGLTMGGPPKQLSGKRATRGRGVRPTTGQEKIANLENSSKQIVPTNRLEIPSAGSIGDPIIAAFPEFKWIFKDIISESDTNEEQSPNNDWEYNPNLGAVDEGKNSIKTRVLLGTVDDDYGNKVFKEIENTDHLYRNEDVENDEDFDFNFNTDYDEEFDENMSADYKTTSQTPAPTQTGHNNAKWNPRYTVKPFGVRKTPVTSEHSFGKWNPRVAKRPLNKPNTLNEIKKKNAVSKNVHNYNVTRNSSQTAVTSVTLKVIPVTTVTTASETISAVTSNYETPASTQSGHNNAKWNSRYTVKPFGVRKTSVTSEHSYGKLNLRVAKRPLNKPNTLNKINKENAVSKNIHNHNVTRNTLQAAFTSVTLKVTPVTTVTPASEIISGVTSNYGAHNNSTKFMKLASTAPSVIPSSLLTAVTQNTNIDIHIEDVSNQEDKFANVFEETQKIDDPVRMAYPDIEINTRDYYEGLVPEDKRPVDQSEEYDESDEDFADEDDFDIDWNDDSYSTLTTNTELYGISTVASTPMKERLFNKYIRKLTENTSKAAISGSPSVTNDPVKDVEMSRGISTVASTTMKESLFNAYIRKLTENIPKAAISGSSSVANDPVKEFEMSRGINTVASTTMKESLFNAYIRKLKGKIPKAAITGRPSVVIYREEDVQISNSTIASNNSKNDEKIHRYTKDLKVGPSDVVNDLLAAERISAPTTAGTVSTSSTLSDMILTSSSAVSKFASKADIQTTKITNVFDRVKEPLKKNQIKDKKRRRGSKKNKAGSTDLRNMKITKNPHADVKLESRLFDTKTMKVHLPRRLEFDYVKDSTAVNHDDAKPTMLKKEHEDDTKILHNAKPEGKNKKTKHRNNENKNQRSDKKEQRNKKSKRNGKNRIGKNGKKVRHDISVTTKAVERKLLGNDGSTTEGLNKRRKSDFVPTETFGWTETPENRKTAVINDTTTNESDAPVLTKALTTIVRFSEETEVITTNTPEEVETSALTMKTTTKSCGYWFGCYFHGSSEETEAVATNAPEEAETSATMKTTTKSCDSLFACYFHGSSKETEDIVSITPKETKTSAPTMKSTIEDSVTSAPLLTSTANACNSYDCNDSKMDKKSSERNAEVTSKASYSSSSESFSAMSATSEMTMTSTVAIEDDGDLTSQSSELTGKKTNIWTKPKLSEIIADSKVEDTIIWETSTIAHRPISGSNIEIDMETNISDDILRINDNRNIAGKNYVWGEIRITIDETATRQSDLKTHSTIRLISSKSTENRCRPYELPCDGNKCIPIVNVCDHVHHCYDKNDEMHCPLRLHRMTASFRNNRCRNDQFSCDDTLCLEEESTCDGIIHCKDGTDETECEYYDELRNEYYNRYRETYRGRLTNARKKRPCQDGREFKCKDGTCIPDSKKCNNVIDCSHGEDEDQSTCLGFAPCPSMDFTCEDGSCIPKTSVCDGIDDCPRAGDELHCDRECTPTEFKCASGGKCIEGVYRCDGHPDCPDRSDEDRCTDPFNENVTHTVTHTNTPPSRPWITGRPGGSKECDSRTEMRCDDGQCIQLRRKCDNVFDCLDNSDERDCGGCEIDEWKCASGECVTENARCDGKVHCPDGSDEVGCAECPAGTFRCYDGLCLDSKRRCDGHPNCPDGSDEINCRSRPCPHGQAPCTNGVCISERFFCDHNLDCLDGSDEEGCPDTAPEPQLCRSDQYTCHDGSCIPQESHCDGRADCPDDEDERDCPRVCSRDQLQCRNGDCYEFNQKCDTTIDCADGSDEEDCKGTETTPSSRDCNPDQFQCTYDLTCVHASSKCNGIPECRDHSDEKGCDYDQREGLNLKTYPSEQIIKENSAKQGREVVFQCRDEGWLRAKVRWLRGNGLPLPPGARDINGRLEMPNIQMEHSGTYICEAVDYPRSTPGQQVSVHLEVEKFEVPVTRPPQVCGYDEATCSNGECIHKSAVCNGTYDCTDGSDEMRCSSHGCEPNQFSCANKECVSKVWRCDGDKDCRDGSDEDNCEPPPPGSPCRYDEYQCAKYDQCIPKSYHCDMERDCQDGSDEFGCSSVYIIQPPPAMVNHEKGQTMILVCVATGVPVPEISWRRNWGHVPSKCRSTSHNGTGTLICPDIQPSDQGAYSCEALNIAGFVIAVPDAILVVEDGPSVCRPGTFNDEARTPDECISCFCFGVSNKCRSADLFTYELRPPFDRFRVVGVEAATSLRIHGEIGSQLAEVVPRGSNGADITAPRNTELTGYNVPYFEIPSNYYGSSALKSYGGYLKYVVSYSGNGNPNDAPDVVISGNGFVLGYRGGRLRPDTENKRQVRFFYGEWYKNDTGLNVPATREEIMMVLARVDHILIKAKYEDSPELQVSITDIVMDTADVSNAGLGAASYVEKCSCPTGYHGDSCQSCAPGYQRRTSGPWLGECYIASPLPEVCADGFYGDPLRNIPCKRCPCPYTNPVNQFTRTCRLGTDHNPICDCPPEYVGLRCEKCAPGYHGNPLIPGDMCVRDTPCDPYGSVTLNADATGKCRCKQYVTGDLCDQCKANTFNLALKHQFGCVSCFCMGITERCHESNWYRHEIRVSFTNSIRNFTLVESNTPNAQPFHDGISLDTVDREIVYRDFPNRGNTDVYYWQLPSIFLGNQITSYGGDLRYTVRYVPSPGGQSSRNNAADVELISANDINLLYYSRETPESNTPQSFTVPLLEQYWQRTDGTQADREHLLMALADVRAIRIKATYTTHTDEAALSLVSLDTAERYNTGRERAVEVEECFCPPGYRGLSCEDCAVGYTRATAGLYLGICEPCNCNGHSSQCDPESGYCENCGNHTTGENCELCAPGYQGDATRGGCFLDGGPPPCECDPAGSDGEQCVNGRCYCKPNVEGAQCNRCRPSTFGLSAENIDGCNECYCSGVTDQCHESSLYIQQIPMLVYDSRHGFTLTDATRMDVIDDGFEINVSLNEIGYRYSNNRNRRLFWSLPASFTGNKVKSYGGSLTLTQHITAQPNSKILKDQDVLLFGNGITLFWTNTKQILPGIPLTYSVPMREFEWRRLSIAGPRRASRTDLMTVLSNLDAILVRASHSEGMTATYISDISLDTAVETHSSRRATQIEACRCPRGYTGTSCETCAHGHYRDLNNRSVSVLGSCNPCPCNEREESCELRPSGHVKCNCLSGYGGQHCQDIVDYPPPPPTLPPPAPNNPKITVTIQEKKFQIVQTGSTVRLHCSGRSIDNSPLRIRWEKEGTPMPDRSSDDYQGILIIRDIKVSDSGSYICRVTDGINVVLEKVAIAVGEPPRAIITPPHLQVREGEPVEFHCEASGNPEPEIEWVRVRGPMNPEARYYKGVWRIPEATRNDAADYKCIARNDIGEHSETTRLYVTENPNSTPYPIAHPNVPPSISPSQWTGSSGDAVRLICARSNYHESVSWIRSGALALPVSSSQRDGVLTIANPIPTDSGIYICTASSYQGAQTSSSANVTIFPRRTQPSVRVEPDRQTVSQGTEAVIRCVADRESGLQIKWVKYGETSLGPNARQIGDTLRIISPQVSDRGVYICRASNSAGSYEASAVVEVKPREGPVVEVHPRESQIVMLGSSAGIQCRVVAGIPVPELHWARDDGRSFGSNVEQLPGGMLRLTNVTMHDSGAYRCTATNPVGSTSAIARIDVQSLPVVTVTPSGVIYARRGQRVTLTCSAQGLPQPNVAWMKSRPGVSVYSFARDASRLSAVHEIAAMSESDEGSYTCQAINAAGVSEERVAVQLEDDNSVDEGPEEPPAGGSPGHNGGVRIPDDNLSIPIGGTVTIRCQIFGPRDGPRIDIDWKRSDRRPLPEGSSVHNNALTIAHATREAAGEYICLGLDQSRNEIFRARAHLNVISPPRIELNPNRQTVRPGESPAIVCTATGDQPLTIEWDAIGRPLPRSVSKDRGVLQFHYITFTDAGRYVCKASNDAGTAEAVAEVLVSDTSVEEPVIHAVNRDITTYAGSTVTLRCDVSPRATIHWTKDGRPLPRNARVGEDYVELALVQPEDGGRYTCQVRNSLGESSDYINLRVEEAQSPAVTIQASQDLINIGDMVDLRCTYAGSHNPRYQWSRLNHEELPRNALEHGNILRLMNVELGDSGVYRCRATTQDGGHDGNYTVIVQGGNNDAPAIETKHVPYGKGLEMSCRVNLEQPVRFQWSKLGGLLPPETETYDNKLKLTEVKAEDAGTYICTATNGVDSAEVPTVLVVTGVVPNFSQAPQSWISLPPLADAYLRFNIEVSFKPENYDGVILYNAESPDGTGDFVMLSLVRGYPEFKFDLGSGAAMIRADKPVTLGEWHTIKLLRNHKEGSMLVDGEGPYTAVNSGKKQGLDLHEPLYIGGVPDYNVISSEAAASTGFVGCISRLVLGNKFVDLIGEQTDSVGVTTCETCAENPCNNAGVCQEAATKNGYRCLCRAGYGGKHCDSTGQSCYPGACGEGNCVDKENGFECYCPLGKTGPRCEMFTPNNEPAFRDDRAFIAYKTPTAGRRLKLSMNFKPSDNGDGILMYCSQSDEGFGDFIALVIKDRYVEFRFDVGSGMAVVRSNHVVQPGAWTHVTLSRDHRDGRMSINGEQAIESRSPGSARTMALNTPLYVGGIDRRRITVNKNVGVDRNFHGCINELEISMKDFGFKKSMIDVANVEDCSIFPVANGTRFDPTTTQQPTRPPTTMYDPCERNPCVHGACQIIGSSDYSCTCDYGYVGRDCEKILKQCDLLRPCQNGGSCTDSHGSYKCDCPLYFSGKDCEKRVDIISDVGFRGDGWLELDRSVMTHEEEREVLCFEISTNKSNGLVMWHGQTPNDLSPDDYIALAVVDGYVEFQYDLGSGPAIMRVTTHRVDDGERHRIILKRQRSEGNIELDGDFMESGISYGLQQLLNVRGSVYLGGVPDWAMTYGRYHDGFSGCIYAMEVQDSASINIGAKAIRGKNVAACTSEHSYEGPVRGDVGIGRRN